MFRRPVAAALLAGAVLTSVALPAATRAAPACAAATGPHAGLVVDTGARVVEVCVALDAASVSGLHLIELAGAQSGLTYGFGLGGQAVCRLAGVGPSGDDCFSEYPRYWGYWHGDGHGGWSWASSGAGSTQVADGGLDGWVWAAGDSGATHAKPPAVGIDDLCDPPASIPAPVSAPVPSAARTPPSPTATGRPDPRASTTRPSTPGPAIGTAPTSDDVTSSVGALPSSGAAPPPRKGRPPLGAFLALAIGAALVGGGWRRRRSRAEETP